MDVGLVGKSPPPKEQQIMVTVKYPEDYKGDKFFTEGNQLMWLDSAKVLAKRGILTICDEVKEESTDEPDEDANALEALTNKFKASNDHKGDFTLPELNVIAKGLHIKGYNNAKEATLIKKISEILNSTGD